MEKNKSQWVTSSGFLLSFIATTSTRSEKLEKQKKITNARKIKPTHTGRKIRRLSDANVIHLQLFFFFTSYQFPFLPTTTHLNENEGDDCRRKLSLFGDTQIDAKQEHILNLMTQGTRWNNKEPKKWLKSKEKRWIGVRRRGNEPWHGGARGWGKGVLWSRDMLYVAAPQWWWVVIENFFQQLQN